MNTAKLPVLTEAEKRELLARAHAGDAAAREQMVEGNLRLVLSVVQRFAQRGENLDDLFQVGCIGLIKAIDHFDPAQPVRFSTYGVPMIIGEIRRFLRDNNALRVSRSLRDTAYRAMQSRETLEKQLGREPTMDEIAQAAGLARREVTAALESVVEPISLEEPVYTDGGDAMYVIDQVRDPDGEDSWISGLQFRQTVAGLTPREKRNHGAALPAGQDPDGGGAGDRHQSGTGQPVGKRRTEPVPHPGLNLKRRHSFRFVRKCAVFYLRLYLRRVAAPPRRCRSALCRPRTARTCRNSSGCSVRSRTATSLCTVDLLHPNTAAAARTVARLAAIYSPSCTALCSGSPFISRLSHCELMVQPMHRPGQICSAGA
mgnify:CR=1 FL=1